MIAVFWNAPDAFGVSVSELVDRVGFSMTSGSGSINGVWCSSVSGCVGTVVAALSLLKDLKDGILDILYNIASSEIGRTNK